MTLVLRPAGPVYDDDGKVLYENYGVTFWDIGGFLLFSGVTYMTYGMIRGSLEEGLKAEYTLDIFCINLAT